MLRVHLTLLPICLGVTLIVYGASTFNLVGFSCAFAANVCSASRIVFYKTKLKENSGVSPLMTYLNVGFVSLCLYLPLFCLQKLLSRTFSTGDDQANSSSSLSANALKYLFYGSVFNFLYNLFSLRVLSKVAPISHSVINIMKRVFIVLCSMAVFSTNITSIQWFGMVCADLGVFSYSIVKIRSKVKKVFISNERKALYKKLIIMLVAFFLVACCFFASGNKYPITNQIKDHVSSDNRINCIKKIQSKIIFFTH